MYVIKFLFVNAVGGCACLRVCMCIWFVMLIIKFVVCVVWVFWCL